MDRPVVRGVVRAGPGDPAARGPAGHRAAAAGHRRHAPPGGGPAEGDDRPGPCAPERGRRQADSGRRARPAVVDGLGGAQPQRRCHPDRGRAAPGRASSCAPRRAGRRGRGLPARLPRDPQRQRQRPGHGPARGQPWCRAAPTRACRPGRTTNCAMPTPRSANRRRRSRSAARPSAMRARWATTGNAPTTRTTGPGTTLRCTGTRRPSPCTSARARASRRSAHTRSRPRSATTLRTP